MYRLERGASRKLSLEFHFSVEYLFMLWISYCPLCLVGPWEGDLGRECGVEKMSNRGIGHIFPLSGRKKMHPYFAGQVDIMKGLNYCDGTPP